MGYRSEVYLRITPAAFAGFADAMASNGILTNAIVGKYPGYIAVSWHDIKWYEGPGGYDEINQAMDFFERLDCKGRAHEYRLDILGEDEDDYESYGSLYCLF
jgi:hypothetical protein